MSDYVSGLRQDLVKAAARQQAAGRGARVARPLRPRAWSPVAVLGSAAALAAAVVLVVGLRAVSPRGRPRRRRSSPASTSGASRAMPPSPAARS